MIKNQQLQRIQLRMYTTCTSEFLVHVLISLRNSNKFEIDRAIVRICTIFELDCERIEEARN